MIVAACQRRPEEYPRHDLTPEHTKRNASHDEVNYDPLHKDVIAAYDYVDSVVDSCDLTIGAAPAWYGWAIREAFLAGVSHAENKTPNTI